MVGARGAERDRLLVDASILCGPAFLESATDKLSVISRVLARDRRAVAPACAVGNSCESGAEARGRAPEPLRDKQLPVTEIASVSAPCVGFQRSAARAKVRARIYGGASLETGVISADREVRIRLRGGPVTQLQISEAFARRKIFTEKFWRGTPSGAFPL
jgi:hypothetical protein